LSLKHFLLVSVATLALVGPASGQAQAPVVDTMPAVLAPGDLVRIAVWGHTELSGDFLIAPDSTIAHPLLRTLKVAGLPLPTVETRLRDYLVRFDATPAFVVSPLLRVFVGGEVRQPNVYSVPPGSTVAQLIALAGGPTDRAKLSEVALVRKQQRALLDLRLPESRLATLEIRSGDQILINRRRSIFYDVLVPFGTVVAAAASIVSVVIQIRR
jgi:protein involved in polysaccharide export with SLBB domain